LAVHDGDHVLSGPGGPADVTTLGPLVRHSHPNGEIKEMDFITWTCTTKLRAAPEAVGVVVGYYYKNPSLVMKRRLREVRKMLDESGLRQNRYFVRFVPWPGERSDDRPEAEPRYPSVFVVKVERDTARR